MIDTTEIERALETYLPRGCQGNSDFVHVTLTWAQSLDGRIAAGKGLRTQLSGLYSKKMTHYLRSKHDAILVGRGTLEADDPKLNCRYPGALGSPQPILLDSAFRWDPLSAEFSIIENARAGIGKAPWVIVSADANLGSDSAVARVRAIEAVGGKVIQADTGKLEWNSIFRLLRERGIKSVMVEGGAQVIDSLLKVGVAHSVIITIAPIFLGFRGVEVSPESRLELADVQWWSSDAVPDSVLCGRLKDETIERMI